MSTSSGLVASVEDQKARRLRLQPPLPPLSNVFSEETSVRMHADRVRDVQEERALLEYLALWRREASGTVHGRAEDERDRQTEKKRRRRRSRNLHESNSSSKFSLRSIRIRQSSGLFFPCLLSLDRPPPAPALGSASLFLPLSSFMAYVTRKRFVQKFLQQTR